MKNTCAKCGTDGKKKGSQFTEGGESFYFCAYCSSVIENLPTGSIHLFLQDDGLDLVESPVTRNIIKARMRRSMQCKADLQ